MTGAAMLAGELTVLALCWRLTRGDGVVLGLTSHDRDLAIGGVIYRSAVGIEPSAITTRAGLRADSMEVRVILRADAVNALDLAAGRWAGARVEMFLCDWSAVDSEQVALMDGFLGEVVRRTGADGGSAILELVSDVGRWAGRMPPRCSPLCRRTLGDPGCGIDLAGRQVEAVVASDGDAVRLMPSGVSQDHAHGRLRVMSGPSSGIDRGVLGVDGDTLWLDEPLPAGALTGAMVRVTEGCDRRFATCVERFGNGAAFGGEPHLPGTDALVRYGAP